MAAYVIYGFFGLFIRLAAVAIGRVIFQSSTAPALAKKYGYDFWKGYIFDRYPESRMFANKMYVTACFIDRSDKTEVGVMSKGIKYTTLLCPELNGLTVYIDAIADNRNGRMPINQRNNQASQQNQISLEKINLEGDFYKHFNVYQPKDAQIETLSLLAPNVMAKLIDNFGSSNIEINEGRMTIFNAPDGKSLLPRLKIEFIQGQFKQAGAIKELME